MSTDSSSIRIPPPTAFIMIRDYVASRLMEQVRAISFILLYLLAFQILILGNTPANALRIAGGVALVVFGLTFFLEGLFLGLMPLGERVGMQLPQRFGFAALMVFGLLLGFGATLAEPAIAALREAGGSITPWEAPLLYRLLENETSRLVAAIGAGVAVAVSVGMLRSFRGLSIKPILYVLVPVLLGASLLCALDPKLVTILGLAWDSGAVTTGPVTVPLVLALGIGASRAIGKREEATGGFGMVMLASAFPVLAVLALGALLNASTPDSMPESAFFAPENREPALRLMATEEQLHRMAFQRAGEEARRALFGGEAEHREAIRALEDPAVRQAMLGSISLQEWWMRHASPAERSWLGNAAQKNREPGSGSSVPPATVLREEAGLALRAVLPLSALLLIVLLAVLRDKPPHPDETALGIALVLVGMILLTSGIRLGLAPLGDEVGRPLPRVFRSVAKEEGRILLEPFETERVLTSFAPDGAPPRRFFYLQDRTGTPRPETFVPERYDPETRRYEHIVKRPPLFSPELTLAGTLLVFLFAFGLGYGSTLAEPSLNALGRTVEELTAGTVRRKGVVRSVSIGVGLGLVFGVGRILYNLPILWLILPPYAALLFLTFWSNEDIVGIAWDCGGVTTGPITVPLVLAMGLGIGEELGVMDGFGVLAMASVWPIVTVLVHELLERIRQDRNLLRMEKETQRYD